MKTVSLLAALAMVHANHETALAVAAQINVLLHQQGLPQLEVEIKNPVEDLPFCEIDTSTSSRSLGIHDGWTLYFRGNGGELLICALRDDEQKPPRAVALSIRAIEHLERHTNPCEHVAMWSDHQTRLRVPEPDGTLDRDAPVGVADAPALRMRNLQTRSQIDLPLEFVGTLARLTMEVRT